MDIALFETNNQTYEEAVSMKYYAATKQLELQIYSDDELFSNTNFTF